MKFLNNYLENPDSKKRAVKKQAIVIVRSDRRGNLPRYYLGFVGLPRAKALAMTAFFHSAFRIILILILDKKI